MPQGRKVMSRDLWCFGDDTGQLVGAGIDQALLRRRGGRVLLDQSAPDRRDGEMPE